MTQHDEKNPQYYREFFRDMPVSDEEKGKSQLGNFRWSRVFFGAFVLLAATSFAFSLFSTIVYLFGWNENSPHSLLVIISHFINLLLSFFIMAMLATFFFGGIQSLIWALILENLYNARLQTKMIWAIIMAILAILPLHIIVADVCKFLHIPTIFAYLSVVCGSIVTTLKLHKK